MMPMGLTGMSRLTVFLAGLWALISSGSALAAAGQPVDWQLGFQEMVTSVGRDLDVFHDFLLWIITALVVFVMILLAIVIFRFNEKANPEPSTTTHHTLLEVAWTIIPIIVLLVIAIPSFRLLFKQYDYPRADVVVKAIGNQWFWSYEYPNEGDMSFDSIMLEDAEAKKANKPRLLAVDNAIVIPVNKNIEILVTASDVLHNWTIPSFGVKVDAVPGRVVRTWFRAEKTGTYYGQCSELCGVRHAFMPIEVRVVSQADYEKWLVSAKKEFASRQPVPRDAERRQAGVIVAAVQKTDRPTPVAK